jgi:hypothetical protein
VLPNCKLPAASRDIISAGGTIVLYRAQIQPSIHPLDSNYNL